jgi:hypothetical protein
MRRYDFSPIINGGKQIGTSDVIPKIRSGLQQQNIRYQKIVLSGAERLDTIAGKYYGDGRLWWIIAAASNIGFGVQVPPGTIVIIPNLDDIGAVL